VLRDAPRDATNFADELQEAYVLDTLKFNDRPLGGVALGAALTPQKRGLPPPRTGRGRRLPSWTAAPSRPKLLLGLPFSLCRQILDTWRAILETQISIGMRNLAVGGAQRARARAMVRIVMVRLGMEAQSRGRDTFSRAAASMPSRRSAATGRSSSSACVANLVMPRHGATRSYITITTAMYTLTTDRATAIDFVVFPTRAWVRIPPTVGLSCLAERVKAELETRDWRRVKLAPATAVSSLAPNSWDG
jgi:hypothetical protein